MKNKVSYSLVLATLLLSTSCAGLISGKTQTIFLRPTDGSDDVEVEVSSVNGSQTVNIPSTVTVSRDKMPLTITVKEDKCRKESKTYATSKYNIMLLADAIGGVFGLTGTSMDMSSGAAWSYEDNVLVDVKKKQGCK